MEGNWIWTCGLQNGLETTKLHDNMINKCKYLYIFTLKFSHIKHLNKYKYLYLPLFL